MDVCTERQVSMNFLTERAKLGANIWKPCTTGSIVELYTTFMKLGNTRVNKERNAA
jgi:hypothetical protein